MAEYYQLVKDGKSNMHTSNGHLSKDLMERLHREMSDGPVAIVDVDGVLRNGAVRLHLLPSEGDIAAHGQEPNKAFQEFNEASYMDSPMPHIIQFIRELNEHWGIILLTSTTAHPDAVEALRVQLKAWDVPFDALFMRGEDNHLFPVDYKRQWLIDTGFSCRPYPVIFIDDCPRNCQMARQMGLVGLQPMDWQEAK